MSKALRSSIRKKRIIPISLPDISGNERKYLNECIDSGWISSAGEFVSRFERKFAAFCRQPFGVAVSNGTAALHLALRAIDIGPEHEVIVPALTFASTVNAVLYQRARPVFIDCQKDSWNMDVQQFADLISHRTMAIIPVHLYGLPCEMASILSIAQAKGIAVIEDCAEAHGATYQGKPVGSFGLVGCFSFYGNKIITTGEGGMCITADPSLNRRMRILRDHGMSRKQRYWHEEVGFNYRMTNLQGAIGCAQLERIDTFLEKRRWIKKQYNAGLAGLECTLPDDDPIADATLWLYTFLLPQGTKAVQRDQLIAYLAKHQIESRPIFYPMPEMPPYQEFSRPAPNAASISERGISLPSFYSLTEEDIRRVTESVRTWFDRGNL